MYVIITEHKLWPWKFPSPDGYVAYGNLEVVWDAVQVGGGTLLMCRGKDMMNDVTIERPVSI